MIKMEKDKIIIVTLLGLMTLLVTIMFLTLPSYKIELDPQNVSNGYLEPIGNGSLRIIEFSDFECPYSKEAEPIIKQIIKEYGANITFHHRDFPIKFLHKNSVNAALASSCANEQEKFWEYHDLLFEYQDNLKIEDLKEYASQIGLNQGQFNDCLDSEKYLSQIKEDIEEGKKAGAKGTPTFFIGNQILKGVPNLEEFRKIIEEELKLIERRQ